ncbi:MAG: fatty acid desaturase [Nannocystaceae bacterium]|nr:fatty acid desaturase [Nannocystaceae bacterium]
MDNAGLEEAAAASDRTRMTVLLERRNLPGLWRIGLQLGVFSSSLVATTVLTKAGHPAWIATVVLAGLALATLFAAQHESGHRTAFASRALNEITVTVCAFVMLQAPTFFREFHWEHHRKTQDREHDPEVAGAPDLLLGWPSSLLRYISLASGLPLMVGKAGFTVLCAIIPDDESWQRIFPFVRAAQRTRIRTESRFVVFAWGLIGLFGLALVPGFVRLMLAWPVAHLVLGLYLMAEHTGLPEQGTQLQRTRTTTSNRVVRWLMWNMPYHAEHHAHPAVPFHALGRVHEALGDAVVHQSPGYFAFHREALRRLSGPRTATKQT